MYYVMMKNGDGTATCYLGTSHEFAAYAKRKRLKNRDPYRQIEIKEGVNAKTNKRRQQRMLKKWLANDLLMLF